MTLARPIATSFNGGELSARMGGRVDTAVYGVGVETCENFVATVEGAAVKRPGFEYIRPAAASASWLSGFRFNLTQDYLIEWSDAKLRFYTNGVRIETGAGAPYEVAVPYGAVEAPFVSTQQSFDRLYMAHPAHPPAALARTGAATFAYAPLVLLNGPFADPNVDQAITVTASGTTGAVTLTAASAIFVPGHVGAPFRIEAADFSTIPAWDAGISGVVIGAKRRNDGKVYVAASGGITGTVPPIHTSGTEWDGSGTGTDINGKGPYGVQWTYLHDRYGIATITGVTGPTVATVTVTRRLPDSLTSVTSFRWAHGAFSDAAGWPSVVKVSNGRLIFFKGFDIIGSVAGDYGGGQVNFATTTASGLVTADMGFRRTIATEDPVLWAAGDRRLIVGTASRELAIGALNQAAALSGDNISADPQSFYGSERVWPAQLGTSTFFVARGGRKIREAQYEFSADRYVAPDATVWCRHVTRSGVRQFAFQRVPEELLLAVRRDGQLAVHPHAPEQEVKGFARIRHADGRGLVLSAAAVVGADGLSDEVWALVSVDGAKSVERMAAWRDEGEPLADAFFVDSGVTAIATGGQTHFSGLTHLAGQAVAVLADGGVVPDLTVAADGTLDLPDAVVPATPYRITIGRPYTATLTTLRPELGGGRGETSQGKRQRVVRIVLRLLETAAIRIGGKGGRLDELIDRAGSDHMDAAVPLYSGDSERIVTGNWGRIGQSTVVSADPVPATILAALPRIEVTT